jgi:hypothetical protein
MADQSLEAFQLGASLYDRAQTQKRMMEQLQMQTAESLLQRQGMELQNKIREDTLAESIGERKAQVDEYNTFSTLGKQVSDYLSNTKPGAVFPVVPPFKSKTYRAEADKMMNNLEKYSPRAELLKTQEKARNGAIANQTAILKEAMQIPGAVDINPQTEEPTINWTVFNAGRQRVFESQVQKTQAQTAAIGSNIEVAKGNLNRLIKEGADKNSIAEATLNYKKALAEETASLNEKKFDLTKGVQLEKLANERVRLDQLRDRNDIYRQKVLQPAKLGDVKLNAVDDRLVKKFADDIANKQSISDAIGYEIGILEDPTVSEYVALNSARSIAKVLNSAEGKDAVGLEESKRLLSELDLFGIKRAIEGGKLFGADVDSFVEKIKIKKGELDGRVQNNMGRVNEIYQKYGKPIPAGTSQTPSRGSMITAPAPQTMRSTNAPAMSPAMSQTNAPAMSGTNSLSEISFESTAEARAKGKKTGDFVIIKGVKGNLK